MGFYIIAIDEYWERFERKEGSKNGKDYVGFGGCVDVEWLLL